MPCRHMNCDSSRNVSRTTLNVEVNWFENFLDFILATSKSIGRSGTVPKFGVRGAEV